MNISANHTVPIIFHASHILRQSYLGQAMKLPRMHATEPTKALVCR